MSKQQSLTPDQPETPRHTGGTRKARPWVVWAKTEMRAGCGEWFRLGRYTTQESAERAAEKNGIVTVCKFQVMHEDQGKPSGKPKADSHR